MIKEAFLALGRLSPWFTHLGVAILGAALTMWTSPPTARKGLAPQKNEGFTIFIPAGRMTEPQEDLRFRGKRVSIVRHEAEDDAGCVVAHPPLQFQAGEQTVALTASLEEAEATMLAIRSSDLKHLDITLSEDQKLPRCSDEPKVIYGAETY